MNVAVLDRRGCGGFNRNSGDGEFCLYICKIFNSLQSECEYPDVVYDRFYIFVLLKEYFILPKRFFGILYECL